jgi:hypothetical protein
VAHDVCDGEAQGRDAMPEPANVHAQGLVCSVLGPATPDQVLGRNWVTEVLGEDLGDSFIDAGEEHRGSSV